MKRDMYRMPRYLAVVPLIIAVFFIVSALAVDDPASIVGYGGKFAKPVAKLLGLSYYWFFLVLGIIVTIWCAILRREKYGFGMVVSIVFPVLFFLQALLGAKLLFAMEKVMTAGSFSVFNMSGQSLYGTLFTTFLLAPLAALLLRKKIFQIYDYMAPFWLILLIFCRMGCFTDGCCGADLIYVGGKPLYLPVQLFEMALDLVLLAVLFYFEENKLTWHKLTGKKDKPNLYNGSLFFLMLACYGVYRFILEWPRNNPVMFLGMTFGQIYSLVAIVIGLALLYTQRKQYLAASKKHPRRR